MTTNGPTPPPCDKEVFEKGTGVFITHTIGSNAMEGWVQKVAKLSGQKVDWYWCGGRAAVMALGNLTKVRNAIEELMPELDELMKKAIDDLYNNLNMDYSYPKTSGIFL